MIAAAVNSRWEDVGVERERTLLVGGPQGRTTKD